MQGRINCRDNTCTLWDHFRVDLDEGESMPADEDVVAAVLVQAFDVAGAGMATAEIVERGARHYVVRVTYPELDIIPSEEQDRCNT
jgi:hypothetical protein